MRLYALLRDEIANYDRYLKKGPYKTDKLYGLTLSATLPHLINVPPGTNYGFWLNFLLSVGYSLIISTRIRGSGLTGLLQHL